MEGEMRSFEPPEREDFESLGEAVDGVWEILTAKGRDG